MGATRAAPVRPAPAFGAVVLVVATALLPGCRTAVPQLGPAELEAAREQLGRPLSADPAALYRLRVPASGALRMSLLAAGAAGRMTVAEPFGAAVSILAWEGAAAPAFLDLREGCRLEAADLSRLLGIGSLPLPQAVAVLCGRLPAAAGDEVSVRSGGGLLVAGEGWAAEVEVAAEPWRVTAVRQAGGTGRGWRLLLADHAGAVPGSVRVESADGRWAELELLRLEWSRAAALPPLPELPVCVAEGPP
jgi:hypothetical protein